MPHFFFLPVFNTQTCLNISVSVVGIFVVEVLIIFPSLTKVLLLDLSSEYKLKMTEVQAMVEFSVELNKFYNVDLFQRGYVF